ncbi:hypothetical protein FOL46_001440 [Perkinsus olseni]|uniref:Uncharacterized protein n=1 Tax=Perkinsus olseni TaxID=32597 RepID=A0A7J6MCW5_PEROL|nr:hypothetical protein FOL46_001440 [Perkinsus olseni]
MLSIILTGSIYLYTGLTVSPQPPNTSLRKGSAAFFQRTSWPIASVSQLAAGHGRYFGVQCMEQHCGSALNTCLMEADKSLDPEFNKDKQEIKQSQCGVMLLCLWNEEKDEETLERQQDHIPNKLSPAAAKALSQARAARRGRGADVCTDGITAAEESPAEGSLLKCAQDFGCERVVDHDPAELAASTEIPSDDAVVQDTSLLKDAPLEKAKVAIQSLSPNCLKNHCSAELYACDENAECNSVFSCLEINSARHDKTDAKKCTDKLMGLDEIKKNLLACAEAAKCLQGEISPSLNLKDDIDSIPAKPSSLLQLSGGVSSHARQQHMTEAEVKKAFEVSRQKTDEILHKVQQQMKSLNVQMDKTRDDEQKGMAELEKQRKDDDTKLGAAEKRYEALETKAMSDPSFQSGNPTGAAAAAAAATSSFMEGDIPDFLEPLREVARKAQSFAEEMKKQQEELDAVASSGGAAYYYPQPALEKAGVATTDQEDRELASAMKAEDADEVRTDKHLAKASDALNELQRSIREESRELALEERNDASHVQSGVHDLGDNDDGLSLLEEASEKRDWETDLERHVSEWRSLLAHDSTNRRHFTPKADDGEEDDDDEASSFLQVADKSDATGDWISKIEKYLKEDRQRVLAARNSKLRSSSSSDVPEEENDESASFLETSMDAENVRSAIRKEAEKTRDVIKVLQQVQEAVDVKKASQGNKHSSGPSFVEQAQPGHFNLEKAQEEVGALQAKWAREAKKISAPTAAEASPRTNTKLKAIEKRTAKADKHVKKVDQEFKKALVSLKSDILSQADMSKAVGASFLELGSQSKAHEKLEKLRAELDADIAKNAEKQQQIEEEMKEAGGSQSLLEETKREAALPVSLTQAMSRLDALAKRLMSGIQVNAAIGARTSLADRVIETSRKKSEELLKEVHDQIRSLTSDLDQSTAEQKKDLELLKQNEDYQDRALENTESKLKDIAAEKITLPDAPPMSSFMEGKNGQGDIFAPLRNAAEKAKEFAQKIFNGTEASVEGPAGDSSQADGGKNSSSSSFLEAKDIGYFLGNAGSAGSEDADTDAAERGLSMAQDGISKLDADIAAQKKMLATERAELEKEKEATAKINLDDADSATSVASSLPDTPDQLDNTEDYSNALPSLSFLETHNGASTVAAASRARLSSWLQRLRAKLNKARSAAGLPDLPTEEPKKDITNEEKSVAKGEKGTKKRSSSEKEESGKRKGSSFLEWAPVNFAGTEDRQKEKREVERLKEEFAESMQKVKDQSAALLAESKADLKANRNFKSKLETDDEPSTSSFVETSSYDPEREAAAIKALDRRWEAEAEKLRNAPIDGPEEEELTAMLKTQREKDAKDDEKIRELKDEMHEDLKKLHKEIALATASTAN